MSVTIRERKYKSGKIALYLDVYHKGERKIENTGLSFKEGGKDKKNAYEKAKQLRAKKEIELVENNFDLLSTDRMNQSFFEYFEKHLSKGSSYKSLLKKLKDFQNTRNVSGTLTFAKINHKYLEEFKEYLLSELSQNSAWAYWNILRGIFNHAINERIIQSNPTKAISVKKIDTTKVYLEENEVKLLASAKCDNENIKRAFLFACYTGLRISDIEKLLWSEIQDKKLVFRQKKTKDILYLPLNQTALNIINEQKKETNNKQRVFDLPKKTTRNVILNNWVITSGINKNITFHTSRHTFATLSLNSGSDLASVSKLLGHSDIKTTQIYAKITGDSLTKAVNNLPTLVLNNNEDESDIERHERPVKHLMRSDADRIKFEFFNRYDLEPYFYQLEGNTDQINSTTLKILDRVSNDFDWELLRASIDKNFKLFWTDLDVDKVIKAGIGAADHFTSQIISILIKQRIFDQLFFIITKYTNTKIYIDGLVKEESLLSELWNDIQDLNDKIESVVIGIIKVFKRQHFISTFKSIGKNGIEISSETQLTEKEKNMLDTASKFSGNKLKSEKIRAYKRIFERHDEYKETNETENYRSQAFIIAKKELGKYTNENKDTFYKSFMGYRKEHNLNCLKDFEDHLSKIWYNLGKKTKQELYELDEFRKFKKYEK